MKEEIKKEIKMYLKWNVNKNTAQNFCKVTLAILRGEIQRIKCIYQKARRISNQYLSVQLKKMAKKKRKKKKSKLNLQ